VVAKGDVKSVVLYWYQTQSRVIADEFSAKFYLVADSIRHHRSDTALVRVVVPVLGDATAQAVAQGEAFVQSVYPALRAYLPS
jgi:EpsI family protein